MMSVRLPQGDTLSEEITDRAYGTHDDQQRRCHSRV